MSRYRLQPHFDWTHACEYVDVEGSLIDLIDLKTKWAEVLKNPKSRKWILIDRVKNGDEETQREAFSIYLHLYGEDE